MGLRTAAARLGFRLAAEISNKRLCSSSRLTILPGRSISHVAEIADIADKKEKSSNLYLFFNEHELKDRHTLHSNLVVRPIRLDSYDDDDEHEEEEELLEEEAHTFSGIDSSNCSTRLGSRILFTNGRKDICWVDTLTRPLNIHISSPTESEIKSFLTTKSRMIWGAIDRKLYCVQNCFDICAQSQGEHPIGFPFEVLDTEINDAKWQPLSDPPFIHLQDRFGKKDDIVLFLNESKKILGWKCNKNGAYCFDTTKPENGWIDSAPSLADSLPCNIASDSTRLVVGEHHPKIGKFNLLFVYDRLDEPFLVYPYFISDNCDSCQAIEELIRLPKELCSEYRIGYFHTEPLPVKKLIKISDDESDGESDGEKHISFDSQFVHLGAKKFCLILHKFYENDSTDDRDRSKGVILVITYEYDIIFKNERIDDPKPDLKIKTRLLGTRRFKYCLEKNSTANRNDLNGAFVF